MPQRYDLLVFDWDGTLMDSTGAIVHAIQSACADLDLPVPTPARAAHIIGLGLTEALQTLLPDLPPPRYQDLVARYRVHYLGQDHQIPLFEGAAEAVRALRDAGFLLAVATGKARAGLDRALGQTGLAPLFHASRCADECHSKPHPQMLHELMDELMVDAARTVMIGDTSHDLLMAGNAGVAAIGACYGAHPHAELIGFEPVFCARDFAELAAWLRQHA